MGDDDEHDLQHHVLRLTYDGLVADTASFGGISLAAARASRPRRFTHNATLEDMRLKIAALCALAGAEAALVEFFCTHWLEQFQPLPM